MSSVIEHRPAPISAKCMRIRSVALLPPHGTPDLLERLGARRVKAYTRQPHAVCKQPCHRAHDHVISNHDSNVCDMRADAEHPGFEGSPRFRVGTLRLGQVRDVGKSIPFARERLDSIEHQIYREGGLNWQLAQEQDPLVNDRYPLGNRLALFTGRLRPVCTLPQLHVSARPCTHHTETSVTPDPRAYTLCIPTTGMFLGKRCYEVTSSRPDPARGGWPPLQFGVARGAAAQ